MQHMQRIMHLRHVQLGEVSPGAAHRIEGPALEPRQDFGLGEALVDDLLGLLDRAAGQVDQAERSERQRDAFAQLAVLDVDEFERAAAEVARDAIRLRDAGHHAQRGVARLFLAGQHADVAAQRLLGLVDELLAVRGLARRGGGQRIDVTGPDLPGERAKPLQRREGTRHALLAQAPLGGDATPKATEYLLVEDRRGRAPQAVIDHKAHRVSTRCRPPPRGGIWGAPS